jgi:hypothetical protein
MDLSLFLLLHDCFAVARLRGGNCVRRSLRQQRCGMTAVPKSFGPRVPEHSSQLYCGVIATGHA